MTDTFDHSSHPRGRIARRRVCAWRALGRGARGGRTARDARPRLCPAGRRDWEERLAPWAAEIAEVAPPPQVWDRIAATLPAQTQTGGLWQSLAFWRGFSLAAGALAAACLAALIYLGTLTQQPLIATIEGGGHRHFVATVDASRGTVAVVPAAFSADATRVPELWLIPADGKPRPLGLLRADQHGDADFARRSCGLGEEQRGAGGFARAAGRFDHRPANRTRDRHRQAHVSVSAASLSTAPP